MTITPTPIPMDDVPVQFQNYMFQMFRQMFNALKQIQIPFTHVTCYEVLVGTIVVSAVAGAIALMYGKGGSTKHE